MDGEKDKQFDLRPARVNTSEQADRFGSIQRVDTVDDNHDYEDNHSQDQDINLSEGHIRDLPGEQINDFSGSKNEDMSREQVDFIYSPGEPIEDTVPQDPDLKLVEKLMETDIKFVGRIFSVELDKVLLSDGRHSRREIVRHPGGACVVAMDSNQYIYMVRQYRLAFNRITLELPAGKLDTCEDPLSCAKRELFEETGIVAADWRELATVMPSPGYTDELISIYLAEDLTRGEKNSDDGEYVSLVKLPLHEAMKMVLDGNIMDAKTCIGILLVARLT